MATVNKPILLDDTGKRIAEALEKIAEAEKRITITITAEDNNGGAVSGENIIVTNAVTGTQMYNVPYNGSAVDIQLSRDTIVNITGSQDHIGELGWYSPDTTQVLAIEDKSVVVKYKKLDLTKGFSAIKMAIQENPGVEIFPIGATIVKIPYVADDGYEYEFPFALKAYDYYVKEEDKDTGKLTWGAKFQAIECGLKDIPLDVAETEEATEATASGQLYYYGKSGDTYTLLEIGKNGSGGEDVPYADYDKVYHNEVKDTSFSIIKHGYNRYSHSAFHQYCNATGAAGEWWSPQHIGDVKPSIADAVKGFAAGFNQEDLDAIASVKWHCGLNTVSEPDKTLVGEDIYCKFILPGCVEMFSSSTDSEHRKEGTADAAYWNYIGLEAPSDAENSLRKIYNIAREAGTGGTTTKSAQYCRLRSAYRGYSNNGWGCYSTGSLGSSTAYGAFRCAPACVIA